MTRFGVRQESWQRIGGESPPRGRSSQPPRPRVMHEVLLARAAVKRSQGRPRAKYRAAKRVYFRGADLVLQKRRQHRPWRIGLHGRTSRSRRPCARGEVLCTEPGRPHSRPAGHAGPAHAGKSRTMSMHADEESDEGVVPMNRSNNEGVSSAETVEGRTSPKGNGGQTAAARTLRRDTASNGLAAVRRAARQSKTVRFTALLHHITTELLKRSYLALARDAARHRGASSMDLTFRSDAPR